MKGNKYKMNYTDNGGKRTSYSTNVLFPEEGLSSLR